ncbi:L-histidine N(alpha)-methyltransferase [Hydrococcus rivularis]|uniref:L-histidine N(alpha)-methyltransferase n=1 Tax=Hydrococcus rivularis TaxID=1616834 RepID=UPI001C319BD7|nr:L-histidine N(alpha)-methyltransferase [Hydrococcus rivularis]
MATFPSPDNAHSDFHEVRGGSAVSRRSISNSAIEDRLHLEYLLAPNLATEKEDGQDVVWGLTQPQKSLSPRYFYDDRGSQLFEQICKLPEYYPTRTEAWILQNYATQIAQMTGICELVELGSGSSSKTRLLLDAYRGLGYPLRYVPIDVSAGILKASAKQLLADYPTLQVYGLVSTYELALQKLMPTPLPSRTICFLGSTLGNFNQAQCDRFFAQVTAALQPGDYFLLGIDLQKPKDILEAAYNDSQGVTAEFNRNMLRHLNWRFGGNFDPNLFEHRAFYNASEAQIEMHLSVKRSHSVHLKALDLTVQFREGETLLTEISRKFDREQMQKYLAKQGLKLRQTWSDPNNWFGLMLAQVP